MKSKFRAASLATIVAVGLAAGAAVAQEQPIDSARSLNLPSNPTVFGAAMPSVVKATAIVNGEVITRTDVDQRLALMAIANGGNIPANEIDRLRQQVLRNLIDETLQIQEAKTADATIDDAEVDDTFARVAQENFHQDVKALDAYLTPDRSAITCSWHAALFAIRDGRCLGGPCPGRSLTPWPVTVVGGAIVTA